jgi:uncharacterized protein
VAAHTLRIGRRRALAALGAWGLTGSIARAAEERTGPRDAESRSAGAGDADVPDVLLVGDSMIAGGFGLFLERRLRDDHGFVVRRLGKSSSGLGRPDFFDWLDAARRLVKERQPYASVVMFGGNDVQGLYMGRGEWIRWHEPEWRREYAKRVGELCAILAPAGQRIFWVGMPVMRPPKFHARVQRVNRIYRGEMAIRPSAEFIDIWDLFADAEGSYTDRVEVPRTGTDGQTQMQRVRVRAGDGIHLSRNGALLLREYVAEHVVSALG